MAANLEEIEKQAREAVWAAEIERRVTAYERGEATLIPAEEAFAKARRIITS